MDPSSKRLSTLTTKLTVAEVASGATLVVVTTTSEMEMVLGTVYSVTGLFFKDLGAVKSLVGCLSHLPVNSRVVEEVKGVVHLEVGGGVGLVLLVPIPAALKLKSRF